MNIEGGQSGLALIVTLLLGLIAAGFVGALMYILGSGTWISGMEARYTSARQAAKGGASYISQELGDFDLRCNASGSGPCFCYDQLETDSNGTEFRCSNSTGFADNATVVMGPAGTLGDYRVEADLLSRVSNGTTKVFTFDLTAESTTGTEERSRVEFIYKVE